MASDLRASVGVMTVPAMISLVTLGVEDVPAATEFYRALGFPLSPASVPGEVSFFNTAGGLLGLYGAQNLADDAQLPGRTTPGFSGVSLAINVGSRAEV